MPKLAPGLWGIPVVSSTVDRGVLFPFPEPNQRVQNLETDAIERWDGTQWVTDGAFGGVSFDVELFSPNGTGVGTGDVVVDTAALIACAAAAGTTGMVYGRAGLVLTTNQTVVFLGPVQMTGVIINYAGNGIAVQVGDGVSFMTEADVYLPKIVQTAKNALGWGVQSGGADISSSIGLRLKGLFACTLSIPYISNFAVGFQEYGTPIGMAYNKIFLGHLHNNKVNHQIAGDQANGWVNENNYFGGRMSHDSGELQSPNTSTSGQPGVRHTQVLNLASIVNNHRWWGTSMENDVPEYTIDLDNAQSNLFLWCRYEATDPKVRINGANTTANAILGGVQADSLVFTFSGGASAGQLRVESQTGMGWTPPNANGGFRLGNAFGSGSPIFTLLDAGKSPHNYTGTDWSVQLGSRTLVGKQAADAANAPRLSIDFTTGNVVSSGVHVHAGGGYAAKGTVATTTATFATIFSASVPGRYLVAWTLSAFGGGNTYSGTAEVVSDGVGAYLMSSSVGANTSAQMSGLNVQIKQTSGSNQTLAWTYDLKPF